ncbi:hypothetical protein O6H91_Y417300 [Diphasiastrum complanatum]|nr:hypothetical protein O6H91_Y417300 [Diphasiastrum complanatum]
MKRLRLNTLIRDSKTITKCRKIEGLTKAASFRTVNANKLLLVSGTSLLTHWSHFFHWIHVLSFLQTLPKCYSLKQCSGKCYVRLASKHCVGRGLRHVLLILVGLGSAWLSRSLSTPSRQTRESKARAQHDGPGEDRNQEDRECD